MIIGTDNCVNSFFCSNVYQRCNILAAKRDKNGLSRRKIQLHGDSPGISLKHPFLI